MDSLVFAGISFPLIPFLGLTALGLFALLNRFLPGAVAGLSDAFLNRLLLALVVARVAFVVLHLRQYDNLISMLDIRDRGFHAAAFALTLTVLLAQLAASSRAIRRRLLILLPLLLVWTGGGYGLYRYFNPTPEVWPQQSFVALSGEPVQFTTTDVASPRLTLVNLWATWCPSCRTEMPALMKAQQDHPDVRIVMLNQGENAAEIAAFLQENGYAFEHVWLDPQARMGQWLGQGALPVTLVFDDTGRLVDGHMGVVSAAVLEDLLAPTPE